MLEARELHVARGGVPALRGVSLSLRRGEVTALCGPNGAGKSTLLAALAGELRPRSGAAWIDGAAVSDLTPAELALRRAVLEQAPSLAPGFTARELAELGLGMARIAPQEARRIVLRALAAAGVDGLSGRTVETLSGGERARAHLARALAQLAAGRAAGHDGWLLLDEPTASLDPAHQLGTLRAARRAAQEGAGVLAVLHDLTLAAGFADRVVLLHAGRVLADGSPGAVLTAPLLTELYGAPIRVLRDGAGGVAVAPDFTEENRCTSP